MIIQSSLLGVALLLATACSRTEPGSVHASSGTATGTVNSDSNRTATSQSNEKSDLDHLAAIRKALVADDSLSVAAKNVQVLTRNGDVLLRGKVPSTLERESIEAHARSCAATRAVDNQIETEKN